MFSGGAIKKSAQDKITPAMPGCWIAGLRGDDTKCLIK
jgi:hypothetical protein